MRILFRDVLRVEHIGIGRECQERTTEHTEHTEYTEYTEYTEG